MSFHRPFADGPVVQSGVLETPFTPGADASPAAPRIRVMSTLLAGQIAAGEVVERPASVVKELVENALDAGSERITIDIEQGGIELIRISDDGGGIDPRDLPLALAPHATSKIGRAEDLDHIATLGFRGEALASIASIARVSIRSRTAGHPGASEIAAEGSQISEVRPAAGPVGTTVTVRNLFFNTPARRKFLRTIQTEQSRCVDAARDLAMGHPAVGFTVIADGRRLLELPAGQSPRDRALALLGRELESELLEVHADEMDDARGVTLWGLVGRPSVARATNKAQHLLLNGRAIRDRTVQHALSEAFRGLIEPSRYPTAILMLEISPQAVDVNVHPAKAEVRFRDGSLVHTVVLQSVRRALRAADLTPSIAASAGARPDGGAFTEPRAILPGGDRPSGAVVDVRRFVDFFKRELPAQTGERLSYQAAREAMGSPPAAVIPASPNASLSPALTAPSDVEPESPMSPVDRNDGRDAPSEGSGAVLQAPRPAPGVLQVHNSFVVTQDETGVLIIDQHALHERVMFEQLLARVMAGSLESQQLLTPVVIDSTPQQIERLTELHPLLHRIGVQAEPLGPRQIGVHAFPTFLFDRGVDPGPFMQDLFDKADAEGFSPGGEQALRDVLDMMACKAAVKAGDRMSPQELNDLLKLREEVERSSNCPHGRPTTLRLSIHDLEKLFGRT